jgi:hypothetical protein
MHSDHSRELTDREPIMQQGRDGWIACRVLLHMNAYAWPSLSDACRPYSVLSDHSSAACSIGCTATIYYSMVDLLYFSPSLLCLDLVKLYKKKHLVRLSISAESATIQQCFSLTTNQIQQNEQAANR